MSAGERIVTERLILREFEEDDWEPTFCYQLQPGYLEFYPWTDVTGYDAREFVSRFIRWRPSGVA